MCGIAAIVAPQADRFRPALERMLAAIHHRGPDAGGTMLFPGCALGHRRLSIVDLAGSPQPMAAADGRTAVVFNGEIYGFRQLRRRLPDYPFQTAGDTELLLALYGAHGPDMLERLPGMFAFALWDDRHQRLFCARDRFGEKPLYYATTADGTLLIASEIKALRASGLLAPTLCRTALRGYLRRGYVPPDRTIFREIHTLPPGHQMVWEGGTPRITRYWTPPADESPLRLADAVAHLRHLLRQAVARQLVADVPVGAFLSGGLDSSTLVALAAEIHPGIKTFSFGYGAGISELPYARAIARRYQTGHVEEQDEGANLAEMLVTMQTVFDEPHADSADIPTYLLSRLARQQVTVALAGEGADELLGGYSYWYRPLFNMETTRRWPGPAAALAHAAGRLCAAVGLRPSRWLAETREGLCLRNVYRSALDGHYDRNGYFSPAELDRLDLPPAHADGPAGADTAPAAVRDLRRRDLADVLRADLLDFLPGDILVKTDRASMAHSLEIRAPFLDVDLASFCITLPTRLKITRREDKAVLRRAFESAWTPAIRRRAKQGFGAPVHDWLGRPGIRDLIATTLGSANHPLFGLVPRDFAGGVLGEGNQRAWTLLNLALWLEHRMAPTAR